jgi:hypothetical protein
VLFTTISKLYRLERDREATVAALISRADTPEVQWIPLQLDDPHLSYLMAAMREALQSIQLLPDKKPVLLLCGLEQAIRGYGDYPEILSNLNIARDTYPRQFPYPILFLLPGYALTRFAQFAPDFWAWKSMEVRLQSDIPSRDSSPESQQEIPVPDERLGFLSQFLEQYLIYLFFVSFAVSLAT